MGLFTKISSLQETVNQPFQIGETHSYISPLELQHGGHVIQWSGQQLVALQVEAVPANLSANTIHKQRIEPKVNRISQGMSEKEEMSHSRLAEASGIGSQQHLSKKQFKSKRGMSDQTNPS